VGGAVGTGKGPIADINVTPLIDVVLVLLVVFMVITPMLQSGMTVDLPVATQTTTTAAVGQNVVISVTLDGKWFVEQEEVDATSLVDRVQFEQRKRASQLADIPVDETAGPRGIVVKADRAIEYAKVREVLDLLAEKQMTTVLVAAARET
jgi:biopolymer transport protein ExbD